MDMQTKTKTEGALFDMDGTLLDTLTDLRIAVNEGLKAAGYPTRTQGEVRLFVGNGMAKLIERAAPAGAPTAEVAAVFHAYYAAHGTENTLPYDGVIALLRGLKAKGLKLGVVSNKAEAPLKALVDRIFPDLFDAVVGQREGVPVKPAPDMPLAALAEMGVFPESCLFVGDSEVDFATGRNTGLKTVTVLWGFRTREELERAGASLFISHPEQLWDYV